MTETEILARRANRAIDALKALLALAAGVFLFGSLVGACAQQNATAAAIFFGLFVGLVGYWFVGRRMLGAAR